MTSRKPLRLATAAAILAFCAAPLLAGPASAAAITPGDLVIYRVGDGTTSLANTGNPVFLDEYTTAGALVQTIALPTADLVSSNTHAVVASGTATSEGLLTISPNGQYIAATGYDTTIPYTSSVASSTATAVPRVVAILNVGTGALDTSTALTNFASGNNPRAAVTTDGTKIWLGGASTPGVGYATDGSTTDTQLSTTVTNIRQVNIFNNQLYASSSSGSTIRLGAVGSGLPTTTGQTIVNLPGFETSTGSPYAYFFATLKTGDTSPDTVYVAEDTTGGGQIQKWTLASATWSLTGTMAASAVRGLTGFVSGTSVTLFGTTGGSTATGGGSLYSVTDATGYGVAPTAAVATIASAGTNEAFRGVVYVPAGSNPVLPEAPSAILLPLSAVAILGGGTLLVRRRHRFAVAA